MSFVISGIANMTQGKPNGYFSDMSIIEHNWKSSENNSNLQKQVAAK